MITNNNNEIENKDNPIYKKSTYHYDLPEELIAQNPAEPRDSARLLVYNRKEKTVEHKIFRDIYDYLKKGDVLVINNTKVLPARLMGKKDKTGASIEMLLQKRINLTDWEVVVKPGKRCKIGTKVIFSDELSCVVIGDTDSGCKIVKFTFVGRFEEVLLKVGETPLPRYIKHSNSSPESYQTVYAKIEGSSAAPTAGLHFTTELLQRLKDKGVEVVEVLLHVGLGTFRPVKEDNILDHEMHTEYYEVSQDAADKINTARKEGRRIIATGTTSVRTLESATTDDGIIHAGSGETGIFIYPGYKYKMVDALITNFHLPESTLIMLVSAFMGTEETLRVYNIAVKEKYRFYSFGDAMFIY
jgi:S-adenosylmethionine:tRNA ribosyltransferase-isomerase